MSDWKRWQPKTRANLCFIIKDGCVLLIRKKRGLGAGIINGPGGKIEPDETPIASMIRETFEELHVTPIDPRPAGELFFQFDDGFGLHCSVFVARDLHGEPVETAEATPLWTPVGEIPYDQMWEDDRHWLPLLLRGETFRGYFTFAGDRMTSHQIETGPAIR